MSAEKPPAPVVSLGHLLPFPPACGTLAGAMPRLADAPIAIRRIGIWEFLKRIYLQISEDNLLVWAAALAYAWLFALFPLVIFLMTLVPYLPIDRHEVRARVGDTVASALPREAAKVVLQNLDTVLNQ